MLLCTYFTSQNISLGPYDCENCHQPDTNQEVGVSLLSGLIPIVQAPFAAEYSESSFEGVGKECTDNLV